MLYILCGQDSFSRREAVAEVKKALGDGEMAALNTVTFEGARLSAEQLGAACNAIPFFSDRRLVIVAGLLTRFESKDRKERGSAAGSGADAKTPWQPFIDCLQDLPPTVDVVLEDENASGSNPLMKALAKQAKVGLFAPLRPGEVIAWIERRIRANGGSISPGAARLLADSVGSNLWLLSSEIEKLQAFRGTGRINEDDVAQLVSYVRDASVFVMVDAIVEHRSDTALRLKRQLVDQGATSPYLVAMITRQFRLLIQAKELAGREARSSEIRRILGISSDFVFDKVMKQLGGYQLAELEQVYHLLLQMDVDIKTGKVDEEVALDLLVLDLCQRRARTRPPARRPV